MIRTDKPPSIRIGELEAEIERLRADLAEIARLRLATDEGSLRIRADRMWEIATRREGKLRGET